MGARRACRGGAQRDGSRSPNEFGEALAYHRGVRGLSLRDLAPVVGVHYSQLGKVERGARSALRWLVERCDRVLDTGGVLVAAWARDQGVPQPVHLPAAPQVFVGQCDALEVLDARFARPGRDAQGPTLVTLAGPAGAGVSAVAVHWAHRNVARYRDGYLYADLRTSGPGVVVEQFLRALGVDDCPSSQAGRGDRIALLRTITARRHMLVVLDNAASEEQVADLIPTGPDCCVLVTSRQAMPGVEVRYRATRIQVGPVSADEATALYAVLVGHPQTPDEAAGFRELGQLCDYLPAAIVRTARHLTARPQMTAHDLAGDLAAARTQLRRRTELLCTADTTVGIPVIPVRVASLRDPASEQVLAELRAPLAASVEGLPAACARLYRFLAVFDGPSISTAAAASLSGTDTWTARQLLRRLASVHVIEPASEPDRYVQLPLAYDYSCERAADPLVPGDGLVAAGARLVAWYLHSARAAAVAIAPHSPLPPDLPPLPAGVRAARFDHADQAMAWCDRERANFLPVAHLAARCAPAGTVWRFASVLWSYWLTRHPWGRDWIRMQEFAQLDARLHRDRQGEAWISTCLGATFRLRGAHTDAITVYDHALALQTRAGADRGFAWTLAGCAQLALDLGLLDHARDMARAADDRFSRLAEPDDDGSATARAVIARVLTARGRYDDARALLHRAARRLGRRTSGYHLGQALCAIADIEHQAGDLPRAQRLYQRAVDILTTVGDTTTRAHAYTQLGDVLIVGGDVVSGDLAAAHDAWTQALRHYESVEDQRRIDEVTARFTAIQP